MGVKRLSTARVGRDEFAIIPIGIRNADEASMFAERVASSIARLFAIETRDLKVSTSISYFVGEDYRIVTDARIRLP